MRSLKSFLVLIAVTAIYTSCTKEESILNPDPDKLDSLTIMGFKDSTLLIKSLTEFGIDYSGNYIDSSTIYFYYDTLSRKINFNTEYSSSPTPSLFNIVHSYNSSGLLIQVNFTDSTGSYQNNYTYDALNILSSVTTEDEYHIKETVFFTKKLLQEGGYSLSTEYLPYYQQEMEADLYTFNFDGDNKLTLMSYFSLPSLDDGVIDSTFYDANRNAIKVTETRYLPGKPKSTLILFESSSRAIIGDQFYNFNKIVYNGIANLPGLFGSLSVGGMLTGFDNDFLFQFTKYPAFSSKISRWGYGENPSTVTFKQDAEYDNKNRLVKFKMYFGDEPYYSNEYRLTYYK